MSTTFSLRETNVVLRDGSSVRIRAAHATDEAGILAFLQGLSDESRRLRFPMTKVDLEVTARSWAGIEGCADCCVVAVQGGDVVAQASYDRTAADRADHGDMAAAGKSL